MKSTMCGVAAGGEMCNHQLLMVKDAAVAAARVATAGFCPSLLPDLLPPMPPPPPTTF